jgi:hypothetical protein
MTPLDLLIIGLAVFAFTYYFQYDPDVGDNAPFLSDDKEVFYEDDFLGTFIVHPVSVFDRFRKFFGMYEVVKEQRSCDDNEDDEPCWEEGQYESWYVLKSRSAVWMCPYCLTFWSSAVFFGFHFIGFLLPVYVFAIASFSIFGHSLVDYLTNQQATVIIEQNNNDGGEMS